MSDEQIKQQHKLKFDGTLTFGHVLTLVSFLSAAGMFAIDTTTKFAKQEVAISQQSLAIEKLANTMDKLADNQNQLVRTTDKLGILLDELKDTKKK